jgi:D-serine deaminase-like pyridoxal phosphate-dependent protein
MAMTVPPKPPHGLAGIGKESLPTPSLIVDEECLNSNIKRMADFFADGKARLRPHAKSHKCSALALRQLEAGAIGVTVATIEEAEAMVAGGIRDILIANLVVNEFWVKRLLGLAAKSDVKVAVDSVQNACQLSRATQGTGTTVGVLVEVNVGMNRCGVDPGEPACDLAQLVSSLPGLQFRGLMGYEGHAVGIEDRRARAKQCERSMDLLTSTAELARSRGLSVEIVSGGGTGTYDTTGRYPGITEVQAGSYALMDLQYRRVTSDFRCALRILATVLSRPTRHRAVIDAGLKSMSTEFGLPEVCNQEGVVLDDLSEEHGILRVGEGHPLAPGDLVELLPSHSCTTVALHPILYVLGASQVVEVWEVDGRTIDPCMSNGSIGPSCA